MTTNSYTISTESGRKIQVLEAGQTDGVPVLVHHGTPGSSLLLPWIKDAESRGIRLISFVRPGYGGSTPNPGRSVSSVAEDVTTIAKQLSLDRLCVWVLRRRSTCTCLCSPSSRIGHSSWSA